MHLGITGNTTKERLWQPVADLVRDLDARGRSFHLKEEVASGLIERGLIDRALCVAHAHADPAAEADVLLSFGGDGTLLNTAHEVGDRGTPILGVNIGHLGFLADIEVGHLPQAIACLEEGAYTIEPRMALSTTVRQGHELGTHWALNEFVLERTGNANLLSIRVHVDGEPLNEYWGDGLILATATGSTAYSLSVGGPIIAPGARVIILTPLAPHSLTVRPIVLPDDSVIEARVTTEQPAYLFAADGRSTLFEGDDLTFEIRRADHDVRLVKLPEQHYFKTIRNKLMWGMRKIG